MSGSDVGTITESSKMFLDANDVASILDVSVQNAYKIIRQLNDELRQNGYATMRGRVSRTYFEEKYYLSTAIND